MKPECNEDWTEAEYNDYCAQKDSQKHDTLWLLVELLVVLVLVGFALWVSSITVKPL